MYESNWEFLCYKDKRKGWISYFYLCGYFYDDEMVIWKVGLRLMFGNVLGYLFILMLSGIDGRYIGDLVFNEFF